MQNKATMPSAKSIYIWNILGSMSNALLSVLILMIVTRTLNNIYSDIFSLAWSISQLMATVGTFQVRMYQATDVNGKYDFKQYFLFRVFCLIIMIIFSCAYVVYLKYNFYKSLIIVLICIFKAIDCFADVYEGWFQQKERLDLSGKAQTARVIACLITMSFFAILTKDLLWICIGIILAYLLCFYIFDIRIYKLLFSVKRNEKSVYEKKWGIHLFISTLPLFINSFLAMSIINMPKMSIDLSISKGILVQGSQSIYNIIFMPASFLTLAYIVFRPLITKMAIYWEDMQYKKFIHTLIRIFGVLFVFCIPVVFICYWIGCPILSFLYGVNLSGNELNLIIIMIGGCLYTFSCILDNALIVIRKQYTLIISYVATFLVCKLLSNYLVFIRGLNGAALTYFISMSVFFGTMIIIFVLGYNQQKRKKLSYVK